MILWWCRWTSTIYYNHFDKATVYSNQKKPGITPRLFFLYSVVFLLQALEELSNNVIIVIINRMSHNFDSDWLLILALGFFKNFI